MVYVLALILGLGGIWTFAAQIALHTGLVELSRYEGARLAQVGTLQIVGSLVAGLLITVAAGFLFASRRESIVLLVAAGAVWGLFLLLDTVVESGALWHTGTELFVVVCAVTFYALIIAYLNQLRRGGVLK